MDGVDATFFADKTTFLVIGVAPNRIDILKSVSGLEFQSSWDARKSFRLGGTTANFPSLEHLLASKLAAGRPRDLLDAARLKQALELEEQSPADAPPTPRDGE